MGINRVVRQFRGNRRLALFALGASAMALAGASYAQSGGQARVDLANPLMGTAPLDHQKLIGNAPPPGEPVYSGQTTPGARLPHSSVEAAPINNNIALSYPNGVEVDLNTVANTPVIHGTYGDLTITGWNPATGALDFSYTLLQNENGFFYWYWNAIPTEHGRPVDIG